MTDDFKNFIKNYDKSGKGAERKKQRNDKRSTLLFILVFGFIISANFPALFVLWIPYLIYVVIYACREWMG